MAKEHPDLYKNVIKGSFWIFALRISTQLLSMLRLVILARLLAPEDFGLLGIALLLMSILQTFTATGVDAALIQKQKDITPYLNTAWTLKVVRGFAIYALLFFAAPLAAGLKMSPEQVETAVLIIRVTGLSLIIDGFVNIGTIYFSKELQFDKNFTMGTVSNLCSMLISIAIAVVYKNPWALVAGKLINSLSGTILSYMMHVYRPRFSFSFHKAAELWKFGRWITAGSIMSFVITEGDDCLVLYTLGPQALGLYQMAYRVSNSPATEITGLLSKITFPAYSLISGDKERLSKAFLKTISYTALLGFPIGVGIFVMAESFIRTFLGDRWLPIVIPVQLLTIVGMMGTIFANNMACFQALNKAKMMTMVHIVRVILMYAMIYPLTIKYGIIGTSLAVLIPAVAVKFINVPMILNVFNMRLAEFFDALKCQLFCSFAAGAALYLLDSMRQAKDLKADPFSAVYFIFCSLIGAIIYFGLILVFDRNRNAYKEPVKMLIRKGLGFVR